MQHFYLETSADLLFNQSDEAFTSFSKFHFIESLYIWWTFYFIFI